MLTTLTWTTAGISPWIWIPGLIGLAVGAAVGFLRARRRGRQREFLRRYHPARLDAPPCIFKVLIVASTITRKETGKPIKQPILHIPGLAAPLLAALTPPDWDVEICYETVDAVPYETDADLVAVTAMGYALWHAFDVVDEFVRRGKVVVVGGPMASLVPDKVLEHAQAVCVGEAEPVWETILRDFERGELEREYRTDMGEPLEGLPVPRYDLVAEKSVGDLLPVQVGRGCPHSCDFCSIHALYEKRYKRRSIPEVVRDVEAGKLLGFSNFLMVDDNIGADFKTAEELFRALLPLGVRWVGQCALTILRRPDLLRLAHRAGCTTLSFGFETVSTPSLEAHDKTFVKAEDYDEMLENLAASGINTSAEMILGLDEDGPESFDATVDFVLRNRITLPRFYILTPIPGTPLFQRWEQEGRLLTHDYSQYNGATVVHRPGKLTPAELQEGYWKVYEEVFSLQNILRRALGARIRTDWRFVLLLLYVNLQYRSQVMRRICPGLL